MQTERPLVMEAWPAGARERALRHALRYRRERAEARRFAEEALGELDMIARFVAADRVLLAAALGAYDDSDLASLATTLRARVVALEAAIAEHRRLMAAGVVGEAAAVLRRVSE